MEENKPEVTDANTEDHYSRLMGTEEAGTEDVNPEEVQAEQTQTDVKSDLSLDELNTLAGRKEDNAFKSKEDAVKYIEGLNKLVGDQKLAEDRKKAEKADEVLDEYDQLKSEVDSMKRDMAKKDFLINKPEAKEYMDVIEAYAEKNNLGFEEAYSEKFEGLLQKQDQKKVIKSNQRITPVSSQHINDLAERARRGDDSAQESLVNEVLWKQR